MLHVCSDTLLLDDSAGEDMQTAAGRLCAAVVFVNLWMDGDDIIRRGLLGLCALHVVSASVRLCFNDFTAI